MTLTLKQLSGLHMYQNSFVMGWQSAELAEGIVTLENAAEGLCFLKFPQREFPMTEKLAWHLKN